MNNENIYKHVVNWNGTLPHSFISTFLLQNKKCHVSSKLEMEIDHLCLRVYKAKEPLRIKEQSERRRVYISN